MVRALRLRLSWFIQRLSEKFWIWLSNHVPRKLAYWCTIRVMVHATTGLWSHEETPGVTCADVLKRW
jgi:hypothetical protein